METTEQAAGTDAGTEEETGQELATTSGRTATITGAELAHIEELLLDPSVRVEMAPEDIMREIVRRTLQAETPEDALRPERVEHLENLVDVPLLIRGVRWQGSRFDEGPAIYAVIDTVNLQDGETYPVTTSAMRVMAQLAVLTKKQAFPRKVITRVSRTSSGFNAYRLEDLPAEEDQAEQVAG